MMLSSTVHHGLKGKPAPTVGRYHKTVHIVYSHCWSVFWCQDIATSAGIITDESEWMTKTEEKCIQYIICKFVTL